HECNRSHSGGRWIDTSTGADIVLPAMCAARQDTAMKRALAEHHAQVRATIFVRADRVVVDPHDEDLLAVADDVATHFAVPELALRRDTHELLGGVVGVRRALLLTVLVCPLEQHRCDPVLRGLSG